MTKENHNAPNEIAFGGKRIEFQIRRSERKTLAITVLPDTSVVVTAPRRADVEKIREKVRKRAAWIQKQRRFFERFLPALPPRNYVSGETHRYLGRQYRLKVLRGHPPGVKLIGPFLYVTARSGTKEDVRELLNKWYRARAKEQFTRRLAVWLEWCGRHKLPEPELHVLKMPGRWGSSHTDGRIYLNPDLIRAPSVCVDYVITHEVCHLKHPNHDRCFFHLLDQLCPNWKITKQRLEESHL